MSARRSVCIGVVVALLAVANEAPRRSEHVPARDVAKSTTVARAKLPLRFEANGGQWDARVRFVARSHGATLFITDDEMTVALRAEGKMAAVAMKLVGARPTAPVGEEKLVTKSNFFLGNDPAAWVTDVPNFAVVRAKAWMPGVDVVWHEGAGGVEYDLDVAAGVDASLLTLEVEGASSLAIAADGALRIATPTGTIVEKPPRVIQDGKELRSRYRIDGEHRVGFAIDGYDRGRAVLIDPTIAYSTYIGGTLDESYSQTSGALAIDSSGNAYVTGSTVSTDYPTVGAYQGSYAGKYDTFVTKLSASGDTVVYSTYIGGSLADYGRAIAVDGSGNAIVSGYTSSTDYPVASAVQSSNAGTGDVFVTKLNTAGNALVYSTYLGGSVTDYANGITVDSSGNAFVTGYVDSTGFPTTTGAYQTSLTAAPDAFITELTSAGALAYSTYLGGGNYDIGYGIAVDGSGNAYVTGNTGSTNFPTTAGAAQTKSTTAAAFVTKMSSSGSALVYSTYLAGGSYAQGGIAVDSSGNAWVTGAAAGFSSLPLVNAFQAYNAGQTDAFVTKVSAAGDAFLISSYLGGSLNDSGYRIAVDGADDVYVTGYTASSNFPSKNALQSNNGADAFITKISSSGTIVYSTCLGGSSAEYGMDIAVNSGGDVYAMGYTNSTDFPTQNPAQASNAGGWDVFVTKITNGPVALGLSPSSANVAPKGSKTFTAYGGSGTGYVYSLATNNSGATINSSTGAYTAGSTPSVTDVVKVIDSASSTATANVSVGPGVSISPSSPAPSPKATVAFTASGGSGTGFVWSLTTNKSGGSINASTGSYKAGAVGSVTDVVHVADSLGNAATVNVTVGPGVSITPTSPSSAPKGSLTFGASGGSGTGFVWSLTTNASGASINASTGAYTAGSTGNSLDTVAVTDSLGNTASVVVNVGAGAAISPSAPTTAPKGSVSFSASGGSGTGYAWSLLIDNSGATINASTGAYTAGAVGSVSDTVKVVDSLGNVGSATVTVGAGVSIAPLTPSTPPKGAIAFGATGGSGAGYTWSLTTNGSGGSINASSGAYVAGTTPSVDDVVAVTDSLGNTASTTISVGAGISISPSLPTTPPKGAIAFSAVGGSGSGFAWSLTANASGGSIDVSTGAYVAGAKGSAVDMVTVTDSLGNTASVNVSVGGGLAINPATPSTPPKGSLAFAVTGGSGSGFVWSLKTNASGGAIDATSAAYTAGSTPDVTDIVSVTDSLGNTSSVDVAVTTGVTITPPSITLASNATTTFSAAGGSGKGYVWSLATNDSGGNITNAGLYTAGPTGGTTDTVQLVDSLGNTSTATVTITSNAPPPAPASCGCTIAGHSSTRSSLFALSLLAALAYLRRRRR